ncbi:MAG: hypothetical protein C0469_13690 [Cyanobacteria bacterium DS2.3.42]|nr:hypothetical protein [Cyanobacteria bacterium DS2.3.42]
MRSLAHPTVKKRRKLRMEAQLLPRTGHLPAQKINLKVEKNLSKVRASLRKAEKSLSKVMASLPKEKPRRLKSAKSKNFRRRFA